MQKHATLPTMVGALALSLTLALTGCGQSSSTTDTTEEATEETTEESADTTEEATDESADSTVVPEDLKATTKATMSSIADGETEGAEEFESLPESSDEDVDIAVSDLDEAEEEAEENKAQSGWLTWYEGGIHMDMPTEWDSDYDTEEGCTFTSPDGNVIGLLHSFKKKSGVKYDVEALTKAVPKDSEEEGFQNTKVLNYDVLYSEANNTLCGAQLIYSAEYKGANLYHFVEVIESKDYISVVEFIGQTTYFRYYADVMDDAIETIEFNALQAI